MNKNSFFIGLCLSLLAVFYAGASQEQMYEYCYTSAELVSFIKAICQNEHDDMHDNRPIFIKNGVALLGDIRRWHLKDESRNKNLDEACSYFFDQCIKGNLIHANITIQLPSPLEDCSIKVDFFIVGTVSCESYGVVKKYLEQNMKNNPGVGIAFPEIEMSGKDIFAQG